MKMYSCNNCANCIKDSLPNGEDRMVASCRNGVFKRLIADGPNHLKHKLDSLPICSRWAKQQYDRITVC